MTEQEQLVRQTVKDTIMPIIAECFWPLTGNARPRHFVRTVSQIVNIKADQIINNCGLAILHPEQDTWPRNPWGRGKGSSLWTIQAYVQGQQDMLKAGWRRVIIPKEG